MQGRGKFNRARFNLPTLQTDVALREKQVAVVESLPDVGGDIIFAEESGEILRGKARISFGVAAAARSAEILSPGVYLTRIYSLSGKLSISLGADTEGTLDCTAGGIWRVVLNALPAVKGDNRIADDCAEHIHTSAKSGANYTNNRSEGYEIMNASTSTAEYDTEYIEISIPIPPGGTLEIDSENFTVKVNGENALYAQSGAWFINDRDVESVEVIFPSRVTASGRIEYTERFL